MEADFSGWATKTGLKCSDGRTIMPRAFEHMNDQKVPLIWQHGHSNAENVLGHVRLETRDEGVYAYAYLNSSAQGLNAKEMVRHGDVTFLSIYANNLVEKGQNVIHGMIREVSLVLSGANPGAKIDYVRISHSDGEIETLEDEAIIHTGIEIDLDDLEHADDDDDDDDDDLEHADDDDDDDETTLQDVYDTLSDVQKDVVNYMIGAALESADEKKPTPEKSTRHSNETSKSTEKFRKGEMTHKEGANSMSRNVFDRTDENKGGPEKHVLTHEAMQGIARSAEKNGGSLKEAFQEYAIKHGITNIDTLFPDPTNVSNTPEFDKRRTEWVPGVLNKVHRSPFSRVRSMTADLTMEDARAKGYIKGNFKKEEFFGVTKRTTSPTTVYKKQKLDRDDIIDIANMDVVAWVKGEMRIMLEEEIARAILIGDGRAVEHEDKIKDPQAAADGNGIRSILHEHELYATTVNVNINDSNSSHLEVVEAVLRARRFYKGSGSPSFYTTAQTCVEMLLAKDANNRRFWNTKEELASALMVSEIVEVEVMEDEENLLGIIVNLIDYNVGADKGGEVNVFDDFDIDYNQLKYLIETRISGALTKLKSALIIKKVASADVLVTPTIPTFVESTGVVTIIATTGVVYKNDVTNATLSAGAQSALAAGTTLKVRAEAASGYFFSTNAEDQWSFKRPSA